MATTSGFGALFSKRHKRVLVFLLAIVLLLCLDFSDDPDDSVDQLGNEFLPGPRNFQHIFEGQRKKLKKPLKAAGMNKAVTVKRYKNEKQKSSNPTGKRYLKSCVGVCHGTRPCQ